MVIRLYRALKIIKKLFLKQLFGMLDECEIFNNQILFVFLQTRMQFTHFLKKGSIINHNLKNLLSLCKKYAFFGQKYMHYNSDFWASVAKCLEVGPSKFLHFWIEKRLEIPKIQQKKIFSCSSFLNNLITLAKKTIFAHCGPV
jgi:hypothetical protein